MTRAEKMHARGAVDEPGENELVGRQRRRNLVLLLVLIVVIALMLLASYPLFNNYWDPTQSQETISH